VRPEPAEGRWLWEPRARCTNAPPARALVLACPHAGGSPSAFAGWAPLFPADVDFAIAALPGRERRLRETPKDDVGVVATALANAVEQRADAIGRVPLVVYGHSLGGFVAYEVGLRLEKRGWDLAVVTGATPPPGSLSGATGVYDLPDAEFRAALRRLGGTPLELFASPELLNLLVPALRADFKMAETYRAAEGALLASPLVVSGAIDDECVAFELLPGWQKLARAPIELSAHEGGHFYCKAHAADVVALLLRTVARLTLAKDKP
jgi:pyochelin biosynthetic protein PchC